MGCSFPDELIERVIAFHRHSCPGLAIGIRASEYCLRYFPDTSPADLICIAEKTMCSVDAIQYLTGCSTGKGNLILQDLEEAAFTFYDRKKKKGFRFLFSPSFPAEIVEESEYLASRKLHGPFSDQDLERSTALRQKKKNWLMQCRLEELFTVTESDGELPGERK